MVEVLVAMSLLGLVAFSGYDVLADSFAMGNDVQVMEDADVLCRDLLQHFSRLPPGTLKEMFPRDGSWMDLPGDLDDLDERYGPQPASGGVRLVPAASFETFAGFPPSYHLRVEVRWRRRTQRLRRIRHVQVLLDGSGLDQGLPSASGFQAPPEWGRAESWDPYGDGPPSLPPDPMDREGNLERLIQRAAQGAVEGPHRLSYAHDERPITYRSGYRVVGSVAAAAALIGPGGMFTRALPPPRPRPRKHRQALAELRFQTRASLGTGLRDRQIPDGQYRFRLEALDDRRRPGEGVVRGLYLLPTEDDEHVLTARETWAGGEPAAAWLGGDLVLERSLVRGEQGGVRELVRTEERLYLVDLDPRTRGELEIRSLRFFDGSREGTAMTREARDALLAERGLAPVDPGPAPTLAEVAERASTAAGAVAGAGCLRGGCELQVRPVEPSVEPRGS